MGNIKKIFILDGPPLWEEYYLCDVLSLGVFGKGQYGKELLSFLFGWETGR